MFKTLLSTVGAYKIYEGWLWRQVKNGIQPEHIAIILDGNRRWASEKVLDPWLGHEKGAEKIEELLDWCLKLDVKSVTLYTFSTENFRRTSAEVQQIMRIAEEWFRKILTDKRIHGDRYTGQGTRKSRFAPRRTAATDWRGRESDRKL